jgi:hypothetical protein
VSRARRTSPRHGRHFDRPGEDGTFTFAGHRLTVFIDEEERLGGLAH